MKKKYYEEEDEPYMTIKFGKNHFEYEELEALCKEEAEHLLKTKDFSNYSTFEVEFWTDEAWTELIGVAIFNKDENGKVTYELDFSETTL